jgi:hypothetical protein
MRFNLWHDILHWYGETIWGQYIKTECIQAVISSSILEITCKYSCKTFHPIVIFQNIESIIQLYDSQMEI